MFSGAGWFYIHFLQKGTDIVGHDVCKAIRNFFVNGQLLKELNHTFIALIPKVSTPHRINDYRPISCCNVIYKCISKILTNRIIEGIKEIVSDNQSAFVPGRRISDNILLTQELMHNYHRNRGPPRCAFKVDIQKAYDTVDWNFLETILKRFGFHTVMIKWIMTCVSSSSYSICVNGDVHGFFKGKRGLRQGDPLSPYLFTLVMEVLTLILRRQVRNSDFFRYHKHCEEIQLINVCFADDLFLFARGDVNSAKIIMDSLNEFKNVSGLVPSIPKSTVYFCNVVNHVKLAILSIMPFSEGTLPVTYLGVPLISTRLFNRDCKVLVEKAQNRIGDWKNKSLSYAGRLQLCKSVISSMHVYWASVLMIPIGILLDIEQLIRGFLWCNGELKRGKAKVAWADICLPKSEGGLGLRSLEIFNIALMTTHIWNIVSNKESLWVRWIHTYKLKGRSLWEVPLNREASWGWLKLLQLRDLVRPFFWKQIGSGRDVSIWFDWWSDECPLIRYLSPRDISREGFTLQDTIADMVSNEGWRWPQAWLLKAPILGLITTPVLEVNKLDTCWWRDNNGHMSKFSVKAAWEAFRPRGNEVTWHRIVWFSNNIPRHAFHLWLVMRKSLKTHDKLRQWDVGGDLNLSTLRCVLCDSQPDSHEHLFFECQFSSKVWLYIRHLAGMDIVPARLEDIVDFLQPTASHHTAEGTIGRLLLAASSYFIWSERNNRTFKQIKRSPEDIRDIIMVTVRLKLITIKFKNTLKVNQLLSTWKMPLNARIYED
ncbi:putative RNA-directed DNA polymerase, eukaryota, reverse transcriptase zinc-binding domain protein [Tanacetum coccineum]|uniref:RNA-directed DNA polymerase, eukaryota, reverse transcriptase zinc-binding domain protein n=1 Tax=Tanacetum coccineum TaxID=301880 RepID=A0ABQ4X5B5_9ASTR